MAKILRFVFVGIIIFTGSLLMIGMIKDGYYPLGTFFGSCAILISMVFLKKSLTPFRWLIAGIFMAMLFTVYPIVYTLYLSTTNMSSGHLATREVAVQRISNEKYAPEDGVVYSWKAYQNSGGHYLLLLTDPAGVKYTVTEGRGMERHEDLSGPPPDSIAGYDALSLPESLQRLQVLSEIEFGQSPQVITIQSSSEAYSTKPRYTYDREKDWFTDNQTSVVYSAVDGTYTSVDGDKLIPGFIVSAGFDNYTRFLGNEGYRRPIMQIILWNFLFAFFSVAISFMVGLFIALAFENVPGRRVIQTLLLVPYPIPVLVSIMVWRALLNEKMGLITGVLNTFFGKAPHFFTDVVWARAALIVINVYLSYPYFYILCNGALKSISGTLYEAARIDGANNWQQVKHITLPMILRILAPLIVASFSFNFNNFTLVWGYNMGLPAMADSIVPMGHTDLLISFIFRLGFNTSNATDYGFSAAITVILFLFVSVMVFFQTIRMKTIKEV